MRALLVAGLGFGDEGKGATVDALTRYYGASLVVRYNGGSQAGHNVITPDGRHHTFSQFGAGTLAGAATHLSRFMLIDPLNMLNEAICLEHLGIKAPFSRVTIDPRAVIITPFHKVANKAEALKADTHHTCGLGVGLARRDSLECPNKTLYVEDLLDREKTIWKLKVLANLYEAVGDDLEDLADVYYRWIIQMPSFEDNQIVRTHTVLRRYSESTVIFEGAQGILLDEKFGYGESTYRTWSDCTFHNAEILLKEMGRPAETVKIGVLRTYATRHGDGPFPTEDPGMNFTEPYNGDTGYQGKFRQGKFDWEALGYARAIIGPIDAIALNHLDYLPLEHLPFPVAIRGYGPSYQHRIFTQDLFELSKLKEKHGTINDYGSSRRSQDNQQAAGEKA